MSYLSNYIINNRLTALESKVNAGGGSGNLATVLTAGNSAGTNNIDMNSNDILLVDNIDLTTINGAAYPPVIAADTLSTVLAAGNIATNSLTLNNSGTATNVINLLPNASATNPTITLTDGTTTNTIDKNGITTRNSVQNSTHFLNFSDVSTTGVGAVQKTAGLSCNPSTNTITATNFTGNLLGTATNSSNLSITSLTISPSSYNLIFCSGSGASLDFYNDNGLTFIPTSNRLTTTFFSGSLLGNANTATDASNVLVTTDDSSGTVYLPFVKTSGTSNKPLFLDSVSGPLTYNPSANTLSTQFVTLTSIPDISTPNNAARFNQVGLVKLSTNIASYTGTAGTLSIGFNNLFSSSYKNYRIVIAPSSQVAYTAYPEYALSAFLGFGTLPTIADLSGFETVSTAPTIVSPVFVAGATILATPLVFSAKTYINSQTVFELENVGYTYTDNNQISLKCNSVYNNPTTTGSSSRTISAIGLSGSTIRGFVFTQSTIGIFNPFTIAVIVYGYNLI